MKTNVPPLIMTICTISFLLIHIHSLQSLPEQIDPPRYNINKNPVRDAIVNQDELFSVRFPQINFEISAAIYLQEGQVQEEHLYNLSRYTGINSQTCTLYPTSLSPQIISSIPFDGKSEILKFHNVEGNKKSTLYILDANSDLLTYAYDNWNIKLIQKYQIPHNVSKIVDRKLSVNVEIIQIFGHVYLMNDDKAYLIQQDQNSQPVQVMGYSGIKNITSVGIFDVRSEQIWVSTYQEIFIFDVGGDGNFHEFKKISGFTQETISAIEFHSSRSQPLFYVTTITSLHIFSPDDPHNDAEYALRGTCNDITLIKDTLFLGCQYDHINYVAEIQVDRTAARINRYYDDSFVEGIRKVEPIGFDKMALIGDDDILILGEAINRHILLQLQSRNRKQIREGFYSFGLIEIINMQKLSTSTLSHVLALTKNQMMIVRIEQEEPEIQCVFERSQVGTAVTLMAVFNTTHCPFSSNDPTTLGGTYVLCQSFFPLQFYLGQREFSSQTANFILFLILLVLVILTLVCAGYGVQIRNKANAAINRIQSRVQKMKEKKEKKDQEMKKI